jgi:hypothetical protein
MAGQTVNGQLFFTVKVRAETVPTLLRIADPERIAAKYFMLGEDWL